jgi:hypothetical protein
MSLSDSEEASAVALREHIAAAAKKATAKSNLDIIIPPFSVRNPSAL